jgi:hypothetical protein
VLPDWKARRLGCDLYLLGSMIVYLFTGHGMTPLLVRHLSLSTPPASGGDRMRMSCRTFATRSTTRSTSSRQVCPST